MADIQALRAQCRDARSQGNWSLAASAGQQVWVEATDQNGWDAWNLAFALRKSNRSVEALPVIWAGLKLIAADPHVVAQVGGRLASEFGWSVYQAELKSPAQPRPERVVNMAKQVVQTWDRFAGGSPWSADFCPVPIVVNRAMKLLKEAGAWSHLCDLARVTDGARMPDTPMVWGEADDLATHWTRAESWYTTAAKAYLEEGRHRDALEVVDRGVARTPTLGAHCLRYLYFDGAKAALAIRDGPKALTMLAKTRQLGLNDWWVVVVEADAAELSGDHASAIDALARAFVTADQRKTKPEFLCTALETAFRLLAVDDEALATLCARVHRGIRERNGWPVPQSVESAAGGSSAPATAMADIVANLQRLRRGIRKREAGTVVRLMTEGSGFIQGSDGLDYYFGLLRGAAKPTWCIVGGRVTFTLGRRFDRKAGVEKTVAEDIEAALGLP